MQQMPSPAPAPPVDEKTTQFQQQMFYQQAPAYYQSAPQYSQSAPQYFQSTPQYYPAAPQIAAGQAASYNMGAVPNPLPAPTSMSPTPVMPTSGEPQQQWVPARN